MLIEHGGRSPQIHESAYVAPTAVLSGDVVVGEGCSVLFGAVLTAESESRIELKRRAIVMDNAVVRARVGFDVVIGRNSLIGPHAHVNGCEIGDNVFVATGAAIFPGARVDDHAEIRVGAVLHVNSHLTEGAMVPIGWIALGDPAESFPPSAHEDFARFQEELDFPGTVYMLKRAGEGESIMPKVAERYQELFGRHRDDRIL
jgi:gamma-carbonic anhydrase